VVSAAKLEADALPRCATPFPAWVYSHPDLMRLEIERVLLPKLADRLSHQQYSKPGDFEDLRARARKRFRAARQGRSIKACSQRLAAIAVRGWSMVSGSCAATITLSLSRLELPARWKP